MVSDRSSGRSLNTSNTQASATGPTDSSASRLSEAWWSSELSSTAAASVRNPRRSSARRRPVTSSTISTKCRPSRRSPSSEAFSSTHSLLPDRLVSRVSRWARAPIA